MADAAAPAETALKGLTSAEVAERTERGQVNRAAEASGRSYKRIIFDNAFAPVSVVLYVISVMLIALGLPGDALMTAGLVLINVVVGGVQEARAKQRLDQISLLVQPAAAVIRDGEEVSIPPQEIVLGDVVVIRQGDEVQVDGVILQETGLSVDESLLTGESDYVSKSVGDRVYGGSFCTAGTGIYEADRVGSESMAQQITARARQFHMVQTPLQREVSFIILAMAIVVAILGVSVINSLIRLYGGVPFTETVRAAAVIVALVPQGLAFMITVSYAKAAVRIANLGALVQRLNAIESISRVDVLCIDKTGTLTTNELTLETMECFEQDEAQVKELIGAFAVSASSQNRTAAAIAQAFPAQARSVRSEVPFDSARKWSGLVFDDGALYVLGAPEVLQQNLANATDLPQKLEAYLEQGLRVLVFARKQGAGGETTDLPPDLELLALVVLRDQLRPEAAETVAQFSESGVVLKVLSGDNPDAVASLARQAGIAVSGPAVPGSEVEKMDAAALATAADETTVFGRITPDHKERIVGALRDGGRIVAMTGDGVNDIPALKRANVSMAMRSGSSATRAVADVVLLNDSFGVLPPAFIEGQRIRAGMQTILRLFMVRTLSLSLVILGASLLLDAFPTTPRQAGVPAFLTVGIPSLVLVFLARPGRTGRYLLPGSMGFILPAALTAALACIVVYHGFFRITDDVSEARTALLIQQVLCGLIVLPFVRRQDQRDGLQQPDSMLLALAGVLFALFLLCLTVGSLRDLFEMTTLTPVGYIVIVLMTLAWAAVLHVIWRILPRPKDQPPSDLGAISQASEMTA